MRERIAALGKRRDEHETAIGQALAEARVAPDGVVAIAREPLARLALETLGAALSRLLVATGGAHDPPRAAQLRRLCLRVANEDRFAATLAGSKMEVSADCLVFVREFGRTGPPSLPCSGDEGVVAFDRRFEIVLPGGALPVGARLIALGALGRGSPRTSTLPVLVDGENRPLAAHPLAIGRLEQGVATLACIATVGWRLMRDLPLVAQGHVIDQIAANPPQPVGKELAADYLHVDMRSDEPVEPLRDRAARAQFQDG